MLNKSRATIMAGFLLAGCSSANGIAPQAIPTTNADPVKLVEVERPTSFEIGATYVLPPGLGDVDRVSVAHDDTVIIRNGAELVALQIPTGETVWHKPVFQATANGTYQVSAGTAATDHDYIVYASHSTIPGTGTQRSREVLRLTAINPADGSIVYDIDVDHTFSFSDNILQPVLYAGEDVVIVVGFNTLTAVNLSTGQQLWTTEYSYFGVSQPIALTGNTLVFGQEYTEGGWGWHRLAAVDARTGRPLWTALPKSTMTEIRFASDEHVIAKSDTNQVRVVATATGAEVLDYGEQAQDQADCSKTDVFITCWDDGSLATYSAGDGRYLWGIGVRGKEGEDRTIRVTAIFNGIVYGAANGAVCVDLETGKDLSAGSWPSPFIVTRKGGIARSGNTLVFLAPQS